MVSLAHFQLALKYHPDKNQDNAEAEEIVRICAFVAGAVSVCVCVCVRGCERVCVRVCVCDTYEDRYVVKHAYELLS